MRAGLAIAQKLGYGLETNLLRKPIEDVPSHKRVQYRRRYAWEQELEDSVREVLVTSGYIEETHVVAFSPQRAAA
ncbi:DUF535 family protein [Cupriavidus plantarum]|uniref:DUF535 family protein n=1 Tax=Cupriavidus plantarum TaxID=942865 RepID=UPI0015CB01B2|nr:DUF535 family protein [Cupriavidus plantarum]NYI02944.1 uncharacterized protein VirK/YbjX [Cupriavidus plantarum]